ncbi:hypothetical protein FOTG_13568 [Fusarium oxysporum f. sp. vasinfectum 25433]|uniref:Uncharacterized protein n=1 Tax=Fusarium oxysporum f. sp. vasinfectum 25433 TaxID=1089449 RepID=X0MCH9_FUSOX|nr:hypothetical protein FOTG_13568 [Fusarium oxysporum f. sp. vasinfectum 25433]
MEYYPYEPAERSPDRSTSSQSSYEWEPDTMDVRNTHNGRIEFHIMPLDNTENEQLVHRIQWERMHLIRQKIQIELDLFTGRRFDEDDFLRQLRQLAQISHDMLKGEFMLHCTKRWPFEAALGSGYRRWTMGTE